MKTFLLSIARPRACAAAILAMCLAPSGVSATAYLNAADWIAALPNAAVVIEPFPSYVAVSTDSFTTPGYIGSHTSSGGSFTGEFACHSTVYPCKGAYQITYTLPFEIIGFEGTLHYRNGYYDFGPAFPVPLTFGNWNSYDGFYGELFEATNTITVIWPEGVISTDSFADFSFDLPRVVRAVPEPASLFLVISCLLALSGLRRRTNGLRLKTPFKHGGMKDALIAPQI